MTCLTCFSCVVWLPAWAWAGTRAQTGDDSSGLTTCACAMHVVCLQGFKLEFQFEQNPYFKNTLVCTQQGIMVSLLSNTGCGAFGLYCRLVGTP